MKVMSFDKLKKSLKVPYKVLKIGKEDAFLFFEVGGEIFYISTSVF